MVGRSDPGVPEALPRAARFLGGSVPPGSLDRLWIFPPASRGRVERGLLVASLLIPDDPERRVVVTLRYTAEETGKGITFTPVLQEEGVAPPDRLPRIIAGVVRRSGMESGDPLELSIQGSPDTFEQQLAELDRAARKETSA